MSTAANPAPRSAASQNWKDLLEEFLPSQGTWTEEQYLAMTDHTNRLVEFTDGCLELLPTPTDRHQCILEFLYLAFQSFLKPRGGKVHFASLRLRIRPGKFREPERRARCNWQVLPLMWPQCWMPIECSAFVPLG